MECRSRRSNRKRVKKSMTHAVHLLFVSIVKQVFDGQIKSMKLCNRDLGFPYVKARKILLTGTVLSVGRRVPFVLGRSGNFLLLSPFFSCFVV